jgi:hypothetical protein
MRRLILTTALATIAIAAPASAERIISFTSPTGNIGCIVSDKYGARCDIRTKDWSRGPRPKGCPTFTDWGQGLWVTRHGRGRIVCAGDTAMTKGHHLAYGRSRSVGRFTCTSRTTGMTCINRHTGHGFELARERYWLF